MAVHDVTATLEAGARFYVPNWDDYPRLENRIAYESDGTTILFDVNGGLRARADWEIAALNSPHPGYMGPNGIGYPNTGAWTFVFPELRNITHWLAVHEGRSATVSLYYSTNTTNGLDGTWTYASALDYVEPNTMINKTRSLPAAVNLVNVRALKTTHPVTAGLFFDTGGEYHKVHFYGTKAQSSRLVFWEPDWDEECNTQFWNWGNFSAGPTVKRFRVKNISPDKRSVDTIISAQTRSGDSYDDAQFFSFSTNGTSYSKTLNIGNLETNQVSNVLYVKLEIPITVANRYISARIIAHPTAWYQWKQPTSASLVATGSLTVPSRYVTWVAQASLVADMKITDGALYRNSGQYRDAKIYRPSGIVMTWAGMAAFTASLGGDSYMDEYGDAYGFSGLYAESYSTGKYGTAAFSAGAVGDNYGDDYVDVYGNSGLYAVARLTEILNAQASLSATATNVSDTSTTVTGGTVTDSGGYRYHLFTSSETLTTNAPIAVEALIVAGGAGGTNVSAGGAGGVLYMSSVSLTTGSHTVTVGQGGTGNNNGNDSSIGSLATAIGGGRGGTVDGVGQTGGSGGGGGMNTQVGGVFAGGAGTSGQGYAGGTTPGLGNSPCGAGGGAGGAGANGYTGNGGAGGVGTSAYSAWGAVVGVGHNVSGTRYFGGGGGGPCWVGTGGQGGIGGGGAGVQASGATLGYSGLANTGGGAGGGYSNTTGGSGVVIIRYPVP